MPKLSRKIICFSFLLILSSCQTKVEKDQPSASIQTEHKSIPTPETKSTLALEKTKVLDTLLNSKDYLILGEKMAKVKVIKEDEIEKYPNFEVITWYKEDVIIGEQIEEEQLKIFIKYNFISKFEDYQVEVYKGELAPPDFSSNPDAKRFITRITKACKEGVNFAGHYTLVTWGCGSPCQSGVVVDRKTGKIYGGYGTSLGAEFKIDSKMIIRNIDALDKKINLIKHCAYCNVNHEIWTGETFEEVN